MNVDRIFALGIVVALSACGARPATDATTHRGESAVVRFVNIETGCWALDVGAERVQPVNLPDDFKKDGLEVRVELRDAGDMMSVCQLGPLKHVVNIRKDAG